MDINDRRGLKRSAREALAGASYDPKKLILLYTGAMIALSLLLALVDHVLEAQIGNTGGLSGMGMRSVLETVQTVLMLGQMVALIFWQIGYVFVSMQISRGQPVGPESLLEGFRRFGPVLRLRLSLTAQYLGIGMISMYGASILLSVSPIAAPLLEAFNSGSEAALLEAMDQMMLPFLGAMAIAFLVIAVPYIYRLRLAEFTLMDDPKGGALRAVRNSRVLMQRNRFKLLKLDVSFWWFYLCEMLVMVLAYGDYILPLFGIQLPWSGDVSYYAFLVLSYLCQLALYWWKGNDVQVTYAKFYDALLPKEE